MIDPTIRDAAALCIAMTMRLDAFISQRQQLRIEPLEHPPGQAAPRLGEGTIRTGPKPNGRVIELSEQVIQGCRDGRTHARDHHGEYARCGQQTCAREGGRPEPEWVDQDRIEQAGGELSQQGVACRNLS